MRLSIIIPAYNEAKYLEKTIQTAHNALREANIEPYEIIVADDASTDETAQIAAQMDAKVVQAGKRNIGAARNAGAASAASDFLLFVDADTLINPQVLQEMESAFIQGAVAGGTGIVWSEPSHSWVGDAGLWLWNFASKRLTLLAGSFLFVQREAFEQIDGFNEQFFASEELDFTKKLKPLGKLTLLQTPIATSPRKLQTFTLWEFLRFFLRAFFHPYEILRNRKHLDIWYTRR